MGIWDKLTGRAHPDDSVPAQSPDQVRQALQNTAGPGDAWMLVPAQQPGVDLVVQWRVQEPTFHEFFLTNRDRAHLVVLELQLSDADREVRVVERTVTVTERQGVFELSWERETRKGVVHEKSWNKTIGGDTATTFDDEDLKRPLREATLACGWGWHPVTSL